MIPEKIPQDFYSRPTDKRIEWWNLFLQSLSETIKDILKKITNLKDNKDIVSVDGVNKTLRFKTISVADIGPTSPYGTPHGLDQSKILDVTGKITGATTSYYYKDEANFLVYADTTNVYIGFIAFFASNPAQITIMYYE